MCDREENVSCRAEVNPPNEQCPEEGIVDVNSTQGCAYFVPCNNGVAGEPIACGGGLHFNPESRMCDLPENLTELCEDETPAR